MSKIRLVKGSCTDQTADVVVNAANRMLYAGGGICGVIFRAAGMKELTEACAKHKRPLKDGDAVMTPSFNLKPFKAIVHAVGPDFTFCPNAFDDLFGAYYNSLKLTLESGFKSISFPLISSGIFGGRLADPAGESTKQCCLAYKKFAADFPENGLDVTLCAYSENEYAAAQAEFAKHFA